MLELHCSHGDGHVCKDVNHRLYLRVTVTQAAAAVTDPLARVDQDERISPKLHFLSPNSHKSSSTTRDLFLRGWFNESLLLQIKRI